MLQHSVFIRDVNGHGALGWQDATLRIGIGKPGIGHLHGKALTVDLPGHGAAQAVQVVVLVDPVLRHAPDALGVGGSSALRVPKIIEEAEATVDTAASE